MSTEYTLSITSLECYPTLEQWENVVFLVNWNYKAVFTSTQEETYESFLSGRTNVNTNNIDSFTPFNELTESLVLSWITPDIDFASLQQTLTLKINELIKPDIVTLSPPWNN
jgi:hypothetical protein